MVTVFEPCHLLLLTALVALLCGYGDDELRFRQGDEERAELPAPSGRFVNQTLCRSQTIPQARPPGTDSSACLAECSSH